MPRRSTGGIVERETKRGVSFAIRYRVGGQRQFEHVGHAIDGTTRQDAVNRLACRLDEIRRGAWRPPAEIEAPRDAPPTFHRFATDWLTEREHELRPTTLAVYRWELTDHLLPHFAQKRVDQITVEDVDAYRRAKVREGRLSATSINKTLTRLAQILEVAVEYELIDRNPAKGKRRKLKQTTPARPSLEPGQVLELLDAAGELDREDSASLPARRALLATMAWAGLRVGEACALRWRDVDLSAGTIAVRESKTDAGVREVDIQLELLDELLDWRAGTPFGGRDDLVFPTRTGGARDRHNTRQRVVLAAVERANERLAKRGLPALPQGLSPHALRRSFISWLIVEGEDPAYVMQQAGHTDPKMTLGVYAKAIRNGRRSARSQRRLQALSDRALADPDRASLGTGGLTGTDEPVARRAA